MKVACRTIVAMILAVAMYVRADDQAGKDVNRPKPGEVVALEEFLVPQPVEINFEEPIVPNRRAVVSYDYFCNGLRQHVSCDIDEIERQEKRRFDSEIEKGIQTLDQICMLTELQKKKLRLSGRADLRNRMNALNRLCRDVPVNTQIIAGNEGEMDTLVKQVSMELMDVDSFFAKSLPSILSKEQSATLEHLRQSLTRQSVMLAINDLETHVQLTETQRQDLTDLMFELLPPAGQIVDTDLLGPHSWRMVLLYKLNQNAEARIKPLLEPEQWSILRPELEKYRTLQGVLQRRAKEEHPAQFIVQNARPINALQIRGAVVIEVNK